MGESPLNPINMDDYDDDVLEGKYPFCPIVISDSDEEEEDRDASPRPPAITPLPSPEYGDDLEEEVEPPPLPSPEYGDELEEDLEYAEIAQSLQAIVNQAGPEDYEWVGGVLQGIVAQLDDIVDMDMDEDNDN